MIILVSNYEVLIEMVLVKEKMKNVALFLPRRASLGEKGELQQDKAMKREKNAGCTQK